MPVLIGADTNIHLDAEASFRLGNWPPATEMNKRWSWRSVMVPIYEISNRFTDEEDRLQYRTRGVIDFFAVVDSTCSSSQTAGRCIDSTHIHIAKVEVCGGSYTAAHEPLLASFKIFKGYDGWHNDFEPMRCLWNTPCSCAPVSGPRKRIAALLGERKEPFTRIIFPPQGASAAAGTAARGAAEPSVNMTVTPAAGGAQVLEISEAGPSQSHGTAVSLERRIRNLDLQSTATSGGVFPVRAPASSNLGTREPAVNGRQAQIWQFNTETKNSYMGRPLKRGTVSTSNMPQVKRLYTEGNLDEMTSDALKDFLKRYKLSRSGDKLDLIFRVCDYIAEISAGL